MRTKGDKTRRKGSSGKKKLRDLGIVTKAANGKTTVEIAEELGMTRQSVSKILNSEETKQIIDAATSDLTRLVAASMERYQDAILDKYNPAGEKCAKDILKTMGVIKERLDVSHSFPKPMVIDWKDGTKTVIGSENDLKDEEE